MVGLPTVRSRAVARARRIVKITCVYYLAGVGRGSINKKEDSPVHWVQNYVNGLVPFVCSSKRIVGEATKLLFFHLVDQTHTP